MGALLAGVGRATITPPVGMFLMGYIARDKGSVSVHDDLVATALALFDGETQLAIVTCDLLFLHHTTVSRIRTLVSERTGISAENVMICCSHTHSGPVVMPTAWGRGCSPSVGEGDVILGEDIACRSYVPCGPPPISAGPRSVWDTDCKKRRAYLDKLVDLIVGAVVEANQGLQEAVWGVGRGEVTIGVNRRQRLADGRVVLGENPKGVVDSDVLMLRVDRVGGAHGRGAPLATLVNYACHAVCLSSNSYVISADWPGVMRRMLEASTGSMVGFVQGAGADVNPLSGPQPTQKRGDTFGSAQRLGSMVAQECIRLYPHIALESEIELQTAHREIGLPLLGPVGRDGETVPAFEILASQVLGILPAQVKPFLDHRFPWAAHVEERDGVWYTTAELQAFRLSDVVLLGIAAEPFAEIGRQVKSQSTAAFTFFAGYTNGSVGYLPTPLAYDEGGYEVDSSYVYYRLPAPLAPACAELVIGGALDLIEDLDELVIVKETE